MEPQTNVNNGWLNPSMYNMYLRSFQQSQSWLYKNCSHAHAIWRSRWCYYNSNSNIIANDYRCSFKNSIISLRYFALVGNKWPLSWILNWPFPPISHNFCTKFIGTIVSVVPAKCNFGIAVPSTLTSFCLSSSWSLRDWIADLVATTSKGSCRYGDPAVITAWHVGTEEKTTT